jgi:putative hydrolase of the HAD superfamily
LAQRALLPPDTGAGSAALADHVAPERLAARLDRGGAAEPGHYGFGVKGFVLSMIETAIEVTEERVPAPGHCRV